MLFLIEIEIDLALLASYIKEVNLAFDMEVAYAEHIREILPYRPRGCFEAACFRNIAVWEELKTLVYVENESFIVFHLCGDSELCSEKLSKLGVSVDLSKLADLSSFGLEKGLINPMSLELIKNRKEYYACSKVYGNECVYTNDYGFGGVYDKQRIGTVKICVKDWFFSYSRLVIADLTEGRWYE